MAMQGLGGLLGQAGQAVGLGSESEYQRMMSGLAAQNIPGSFMDRAGMIRVNQEEQKIKKPKTIRQELQEETNKWLKDALK